MTKFGPSGTQQGDHRRSDRRSRGQAFVELALVLPVLLLLTLGAIDLGRLFFAEISVTNAAREGAMVGAETPTSYQANGACDSSTNAVVCAAINEAHGFVTVAPTDVVMTCNAACVKTYGNKVTVTVTGHFTVLTPIIWLFTGGQNVTFQRVATADIIVVPQIAQSSPGPTAGPTATPTAAPTASPTASPPTCVAPIVNFTFSQASKNGPVAFTSTSTPTSGVCAITYWRWEFGDGQWSAGAVSTASHDYGSNHKGDTFQVTLTVTTPGGTFWIIKSVTTLS